MRALLLGVGFALSVGVALGVGCAAGNARDPSSGGAGGAGGPDGGGAGGGFDKDAACAIFSAEASQAPAAMLIVLDASASMNVGDKWGTAQLAVVSAIDRDVFDTMSLGLVTFPASFDQPPDCLCDFYGLDPASCQQVLAPGVSCGVSALPQVAITPAGEEKSNGASGVRKDIYQYLVSNQPLSNSDDGSPIYDALAAGYTALRFQEIDKRFVVLITDGGFSCTSLSNPPRPGYSDGACPDWEYPDSVNALVAQARADPETPINTFVVGVPGSATNGGTSGQFANAPYPMRLALSTYAVSGAPDAVDPGCSKDAVFSQSGADPAIPCHFDLSDGASFNPDTLASAIAEIRGKALGCVYDLPPPPSGQEINAALVNVNVTLGGTSSVVPKRSDPADACAETGCWDYNGGGQVEILGQTCADIVAATDAKVEIVVGCSTLLK